MIIQSNIDNITIFYRFLKSNYRSIIITSLGLIISLSIISSTSIFVETERSSIISYYTENRNFMWELESYGDEEFNIQIDLVELSSQFNNSLEKFDLLSSVESIAYLHYFDSPLQINLSQDPYAYRGVTVYEINMDRLSEILEPGSSIHNNTLNNQNAVFLEFDSKPGLINNVSIGNEYSLFVSYGFPEVIEPIINITITGKKFISYEQKEKFENEIPELRRMWGNQLLIVQNLTSFIQEFDQNIANIDDPDFYFYKSEHLTLMYMSNAKYFDSLDIGATLRKLELLRSDVEENILGGNDRWFSGWFSDNVYWTLKEIENQVTFLLVMLFLFSSPVFILALFLAYYSFGLIKRQKFQQLGVMLSRGIKRSQLSILLILEVFVSLIIAIIMGILLSIPFSTIFVQSSGLLEFDNPRSPVILLLDLVRFITPIGFILIVITNLFSIYRTSNITLATIEKHMNKEQTDPFWQKKYLDVVFLILGIGIILVVSEINLRQDRDMNLAFLNFLLIPAPILLVTGAVMFISRIFAIVTDRISVLLWKKKSGLLSFSLKNVVRHKQASIRAILLISINVAFIIAFLTFPFSNFAYQEERISYDIGAEMFVSLNNITQYTNHTYFSEVLENVSQDIDSYTQIIRVQLKGNNVIAVNTSDFLESAYFKDSYSSNIKSKLKELSTNNMSTILYQKNLQAIGKKVNDTFAWPTPYQGPPSGPSEIIPSYIFNITGSFNYFPKLLNWQPYNARTEFYGVMSLGTYTNLEKLSENVSEGYEWDYGLSNAQLGLYLKPKDSANTTLMAEILENNTLVNYVRNLDDELKQVFENPNSNSLFGLINSNIVFLLIITLFVLIMFGILQIIERGKEVATERVLGMTLKQTFLLFIYETNWLLIFGLVSGLIFGAFVSWIFIYPFATSGIPPLTMVYPVELISILLILILVGATLFNFIPAYLSSKIEITRLLKVE
ncbi:MAG: hypothetical protein HeimC3_17410 [Candidatus Heimdallarchaeota archaeon LC_3]|nr:MAG: hypothetical protein HeimC3_17410 [Candidatus Heimdallarchaeota archaeon LC_3]